MKDGYSSSDLLTKICRAKKVHNFIEKPAEVVAVAKASEHYKGDRFD